MVQRLTADAVLSGIGEEQIVELTSHLVAISSVSGTRKSRLNR